MTITNHRARRTEVTRTETYGRVRVCRRPAALEVEYTIYAGGGVVHTVVERAA